MEGMPPRESARLKGEIVHGFAGGSFTVARITPGKVFVSPRKFFKSSDLKW
jgi:hypothetical protein